MVSHVSLTNRGVLLISRGWLKGRQQKNNLWAYIPKVCPQDICNMWQEHQSTSAHVQHSDCRSHTAQLSNYCSHVTFMMPLLCNQLESWGMLWSWTPRFGRSCSPSGSDVTSGVGVCDCWKAESTCGQIITDKTSKQQQKPAKGK